MFGFGKSGKEKQARDQLSALGLDPSLFDDPEVSDDDEPEIGSDAYIESFASETIVPDTKAPDVSHLLGGGDDDSDVELDEQDLADDSELTRSLARLLAEDDDDDTDPTQLPPSKQIARLEEELLETKRAAIFFRQQNLIEEAREQLVLIKELNEKIAKLRAQDPTSQSQKPAPAPVRNPPRTTDTSSPASGQTSLQAEKKKPENDPFFVASPSPSGMYQLPGMALSPLAPQAMPIPSSDATQNANISSSPLDLAKFAPAHHLEPSTTLESDEDEEPLEEEPDPTPDPSPAPREEKKEAPVHATSVPNLSVTDEELEAELSELGTKPTSNPLAQKIIVCEKEKALCMTKAIELKNEDRKVEAIQWLRSAKLFQSALQMLQAGEDVDMDGLMAQAPTHQGQSQVVSTPSRASTPSSPSTPTPSKPVVAPSTPQQAPAPAKSAVPQLNEAERKRILSFMALEKALTAQTEKWKEYALSYKAAGELPLAVKYHNERKSMLEDLKQLQEAKDVPGMPLPEYSKEKYTHVREVHFRNRLEPDELEVAIVQASHIKVPAGYVTVDSYVAVTCPCASDEPLWKTHKESANNSPVFKEVHRYKIDRSKRNFVKLLERKKITFELFHSRWLRGDVSLGKCELSLTDIRTKAEIKEDLPILVAGRKTKGTLAVRIRVCYPLQQKHLVQEDEDIIVIRSDPLGTHSQPPTPIPSSQQEMKPTTQPASTPATPVKPLQTASAPIVSTPKSQAPSTPVTPKPAESAATAPPDPDEEVDLNPVENMMSNDVLEWGLELVDKEIAQWQAKGQPVPEELITKKQQIDLKMQLLIIQIQTGKMSEEDYVAAVQQKIAEEKTLARNYMTAKNQQGARLALTRAKIMTVELEGEE